MGIEMGKLIDGNYMNIVQKIIQQIMNDYDSLLKYKTRFLLKSLINKQQSQEYTICISIKYIKIDNQRNKFQKFLMNTHKKHPETKVKGILINQHPIQFHNNSYTNISFTTQNTNHDLNRHLATTNKSHLLKNNENIESTVYICNQASNNMTSRKLVKLTDVNTLIRNFAYNIQERFQELDGIANNIKPYKHTYSCGGEQPSKSFCDDDLTYYIRKFKDYCSDDQSQIKYVEKMITRVQQIIQFFKQRAKKGFMIEQAVKRMEDKFSSMMASNPVPIGDIFTKIVDIAENGFTYARTRANTINLRQKRYNHSKTSHKTQIHSSKQNQSFVKIQRVPEQKRRISFSAKRKPRITITKQKQPSTICQIPMQVQISNIYSIMNDLDIGYLTSLAEARMKIQKMDNGCKRLQKNQKRMQRQMLKQNSGIISLIHQYERDYLKKRKRFDHNQSTIQSNPLKQIKNRVHSMTKHGSNVLVSIYYEQNTTKKNNNNSIHSKQYINKNNSKDNNSMGDKNDEDKKTITNKISNFNASNWNNGNNWMARKRRFTDAKKKRNICVQIENQHNF